MIFDRLPPANPTRTETDRRALSPGASSCRPERLLAAA
jgi:hypothetical protein